MKRVTRAVISFLVVVAACGGNVVVDEAADVASRDRCDEVPLPASVTTCGGEIGDGVCSLVQCDDAGHRYEMRCSTTGCECLVDGEVLCSGEGDENNTCPNGIPALRCPGISWAEVG